MTRRSDWTACGSSSTMSGVVSDAGIALVATLAGRLGIERLVGQFVRLRRDRPGAANAGRKVMALIFAMLLGADSIDDCELLRAVARAGCWGLAAGALDAGDVPAGIHLRACAPARSAARRDARRARGGRVLARARSGWWSTSTASSVRFTAMRSRAFGFGYTKRRGYHPLLATPGWERRGAARAPAQGHRRQARGVLRFAEELVARVARAAPPARSCCAPTRRSGTTR